MSLFRFEEHDIFLPMIVLEELDGHKKGMTEVARNARQASRTLDALAGAQGADISAGLKLNTTGHPEAGGCLFFQTQALSNHLPISLPQGKADNQILGVVQALREQHAPRDVVLVSKDINMRVKARALGLATDDYQNDKTLDDLELLYSGAHGPALGLLGQARQDHRELAKRPAHLLPHHRPRRAQPADQPVRLFRVARRAQPVCAGHGNPRQDGGAQDPEGLRPPEERGLGRDHAQPRAELRDEPADGPGGRLRHADRHGRHRQDADGAGLGPDPGAGRPPLHRDHHDPRHRERGRGHRLPAGHRRGKDGPLDGRAGRQPRGAGQDRTPAPANGAAPRPTS